MLGRPSFSACTLGFWPLTQVDLLQKNKLYIGLVAPINALYRIKFLYIYQLKYVVHKRTLPIYEKDTSQSYTTHKYLHKGPNERVSKIVFFFFEFKSVYVFQCIASVH